jgi:hypothetical protein
LLAEGALTPHRVQLNKQARLEQPVRWNRWSTTGAVHVIERWRKLSQRAIGEALHRSQGMTRWHLFLEVHERQHARLRIPAATHAVIRDLSVYAQLV